MPIIIGPDTTVIVDLPLLPTIQVAPPSSPTVVLTPPGIPAAGPAAPVDPTVTLVPVAGPPGPRGPAGVSTNASCVWPVPVPVYLVQVQHNLGFYPAGVLVIDTGGSPVEYASLTYVSTDITEVTFDVPFSGTIYLS